MGGGENIVLLRWKVETTWASKKQGWSLKNLAHFSIVDNEPASTNQSVKQPRRFNMREYPSIQLSRPDPAFSF